MISVMLYHAATVIADSANQYLCGDIVMMIVMIVIVYKNWHEIKITGYLSGYSSVC